MGFRVGQGVRVRYAICGVPYFHFGIVSQVDREGRPAAVVHMSNTRGNMVLETDGRHWEASEPYAPPKAVFSEAEALLRARTMLGTPYDLLENNCENFFNWCFCGTLDGEQTDRLHVYIGMVIAAVAGTSLALGEEPLAPLWALGAGAAAALAAARWQTALMEGECPLAAA